MAAVAPAGAGASPSRAKSTRRSATRPSEVVQTDVRVSSMLPSPSTRPSRNASRSSDGHAKTTVGCASRWPCRQRRSTRGRSIANVEVQVIAPGRGTGQPQAVQDGLDPVEDRWSVFDTRTARRRRPRPRRCRAARRTRGRASNVGEPGRPPLVTIRSSGPRSSSRPSTSAARCERELITSLVVVGVAIAVVAQQLHDDRRRRR